MEKISVIIPVYKVEEYLEQCVDSISDQTYKNLEIILVDDGSPDNCGKMCDEYAQKDNRIKVIHKENGGLSDARNAGLEVADGEYIFFVDSDDYIDKEMIERLYQLLKKDNSDMSVCDKMYVSETCDIIKEQKHLSSECIVYTPTEFLKIILHHVEAWAKLYKRELFEGIRFPKGKINEDVFIAHRIAYKCKSISYIPQSMYFYRMRNKSIMRSGYNIRHLDAVEGFMDMAEFDLGINLPAASIRAYERAITLFTTGLVNLDKKDAANAKRLKELRKRMKKLYFKEMTSKIPAKSRLKITLFYINPYLLQCFYNKNEKSNKNEQ